MAGTIFVLGAVRVFVAAEDHPPPHIHAWNAGEKWRARFRFSFLSDIAGIYGVRMAGRRPRVRTLTMIEDAVIENIAVCRATWWGTQGTTGGLGLVNRRIELRQGPDGVLARVPLRPTARALAITAAAYDPAAQQVHLVLADGRRLALAAGRHIEETEEWS